MKNNNPLPFSYSTVSSEEELLQILHLQKQNVKSTLDESDMKKEGFVTIQHTLSQLKKLNHPYSHVIAKCEKKVVGFALISLLEHCEFVPFLQAFHELLKGLNHEGYPLSTYRYVIMGQVCVDREYRGKGIFRGLYKKFEDEMKSDFDYIVTEISNRNQRSLNAHFAIGFEAIKTHKAENQDWVIVIKKIASK